MRPPLISAVIPTRGRKQLERAIRSARDQLGVDTEIIVVADLASAPVPAAEGADVLLFTGGDRGGAVGRNMGVDAASGDYIGFLDDDDEWRPEKSQVQIAALHLTATTALLASSRFVHRHAMSGDESHLLPDHTMTRDASPEAYLFRRRRPTAGRASLYTSTLLGDRDLVGSVRWDEHLRRHQDWDWIINACRTTGAEVVHCPQVLAVIETGTASSMSASKDWSSSLEWAEHCLQNDAHVRADFLSAQTLRYALDARSAAGVKAVLGSLLDSRTRPSLSSLLTGLAGVVPRSALERFMVRNAAR